ncbi:hypothetical protein [Afifella pfennigii]|uniref:hypothetical protein n=1 Tax=Afifella pfennigii TaxID=209897 RepID=UPI0012EB1A52|nr:hypothetical protein [Afifella pfennigii]
MGEGTRRVVSERLKHIGQLPPAGKPGLCLRPARKVELQDGLRQALSLARLNSGAARALLAAILRE